MRRDKLLNARKVQAATIFYSNDPPGPYALKHTEVIMEFVKKPESKMLISLISEAFAWPLRSSP